MWWSAFIFAVLVIGCSSHQDAGAEPGPTPPPTCPDGFRVDGTLCSPAVPGECPAGTASFIGDERCAEVGAKSCADGFERDASGVGCAAPPSPPCDVTSRSDITSGACRPIGDCDAPFPPAAATMFVDASLPLAAVDATHKRGFNEAVAAAPAGSVIAVAEGTYGAHVTIDKPLTIIGRCAAKVVFDKSETTTSDAAFRVRGTSDVSLSGFTVRGHQNPITLVGSASATVNDVIVDGPVGAGFFVERSRLTARRVKVIAPHALSGGEQGFGVAAGVGSSVTLDEADLVGGAVGVYAASEGTLVTMRRSHVGGQVATTKASRGAGAYAADNAKIVIERSLLGDLEGDAAATATSSGTVELEGCIVRNVKRRDTLAYGHGVLAFAGGHVVVRSSTIANAESVSAEAKGAGSTLVVEDTSTRGPAATAPAIFRASFLEDAGSGMGILLHGGAAGEVRRSFVSGAWAAAMAVSGNARMSVERVAARDLRPIRSDFLGASVASGVVLVDGSASLDQLTVDGATLAALQLGRNANVSGRRVLLRKTAPGAPLELGAGIIVGSASSLDLAESAVDESSLTAIYARGQRRATLRLTKSSISRTQGGSSGQGLLIDTAAEVVFDEVHVSKSGQVGVLANGGTARLSRCVFSDNAIAMHVQGGATLRETADEAVVAQEIRVSPDTTFIRNGTKLGAGLLPLPEPIPE